MPQLSGPKVYRVVELTHKIKSSLEEGVGSVWVEGEVSNMRRPASGHCYFTIKDEWSQIGAVLFRGAQRGLRMEPRDGTMVRVFGDVTVYERGGNYQIVVRQMESVGKGDLQAQFEKLKEKLRAEGLFDETRKRPIPRLPRRVGVVTSRTGAAIRDILNVVSRRFPNLHIVIVPVKVQGEGAAAEIAEAVDLLNRLGGMDVLIVGRGGGSLEDLWAFNEESVARALARSRIPVISAVGHEVDFTIADFVADLRAPTPSAAAELVVERKETLSAQIEELKKRLRRTVGEGLLRVRHRLETAGRSYVFREPENLVRGYLQKIEAVRLRMGHAATGRLHDGQQRLDDSRLRMGHAMVMRRQVAVQEVRRVQSQLQALDPLAVMKRGYSLTTDSAGRVLRSVREVTPGQSVRTRLADGTFEAKVAVVQEQKGDVQ